MKIDPEEFRRHFAELSDEGLLSIIREELVGVALEYYDEELARRGLALEHGVTDAVASDAITEVDDDFVAAATFLFPDEAKVARTLLQSAGILCYIENEHTLSAVWTWNYVLGGLRLMVPGSSFEDTRQILEAAISEEEIMAQFDAAEHREVTEEDPFPTPHVGRGGSHARGVLLIAMMFAPAADHLRLFYL